MRSIIYYQVQFSFCGPLKAHPLKSTVESGSSCKSVRLENNFGNATCPIRHLEIQAPAQKWGPAPKVIVFDLFWLISNSSGFSKHSSSLFPELNIRKTRSFSEKLKLSILHVFVTRRGDMPIGEIHLANSSKASNHVN